MYCCCWIVPSRKLSTGLLFACLVSLMFLSLANAMQRTPENASPYSDEEAIELKDDANLWNLSLPTLGGKQFWTDHRWWQGWRVQYNSTLDHWRLLDPNSVPPCMGRATSDDRRVGESCFGQSNSTATRGGRPVDCTD